MTLTSCNMVTSPLRSLLPSPVGDRISEVPSYVRVLTFAKSLIIFSVSDIRQCCDYNNK